MAYTLTFSVKRALFRENCFLSSVAVLGRVLQMGLISGRPHTILKGGWCLFMKGLANASQMGEDICTNVSNLYIYHSSHSILPP